MVSIIDYDQKGCPLDFGGDNRQSKAQLQWFVGLIFPVAAKVEAVAFHAS